MDSKGKKKISLVRFGLVAAALAAVVGITILGVSTASANPGRTNACTNCHTYHGGSLRIATDAASKTVTPGASFTVNISFTGGGSSRTEVNWPNVLNNALFAPTPGVPFSSLASAGNTSSTLTAPTTLGTYTVRVYAAQNLPKRETDYKDITITVAGVAANYTINAFASANGTITPSGEVTVSAGSNQSFAINASAGYHVADVVVDGVSIGALANYTLSGVTANHTISASFAPGVAANFTINASVGANGNITPSGAVLVTSGSNQSFTINASAGYHVADVKVDGASVGAVTGYTFTGVNSGHIISVTFAANPFNNGGGSGEENDNGDEDIDDDDDINENEHEAYHAERHDNEHNRNNHENKDKKNHGDDHKNKEGDRGHGDSQGHEDEDD